MTNEASRTVQCGLCGFEFDPSAMQCHSACPMNATCAVLCCQQCGYQMVDESRATAASWLRRLFSGKAAPAQHEAGTRRLSELSPGQSGEVMAIESRQASRLDRLGALGLVPGSIVTLLQRAPAFILRVGETELTVDESIASEILTRA